MLFILIFFLQFDLHADNFTFSLSFSPIVGEEEDAALRYCKNFRDMTGLHGDFLRPLLCEMFSQERVNAYYACIYRPLTKETKGK